MLLQEATVKTSQAGDGFIARIISVYSDARYMWRSNVIRGDLSPIRSDSLDIFPCLWYCAFAIDLSESLIASVICVRLNQSVWAWTLMFIIYEARMYLTWSASFFFDAIKILISNLENIIIEIRTFE